LISVARRSHALLATVLSFACLAAVSAVAAPAGASVKISGTLTSVHADNFNGTGSTSRYYLNKGGKRTLLHLRSTQAAKAEPGARVNVVGTRNSSGSVSVDSLKQRSAANALAAQATTKKVAVMLINFNNNQAEPFTPAQVHQKMFTDPDSTKAYYDEESGGSFQIEGVQNPQGDVLGWYTLDRDDAPCSWNAWGDEAVEIARDQGVDIDAYDHLVLNTPPVPSCDHGGIAELPGRFSHVPGNIHTQVVAHELGHNFGVNHSSAIDCGNDPVPIEETVVQCNVAEYGDPFDVMGSGFLLQHNNAHKNNLGILSGTTREVTSDGIYTLEPSEPGFSGDQLLRIRRGASGLESRVFNHFYLDFRQPFGFFDSFSPTSPQATGVTIRISGEYGTTLQTRLLDATPQTPLDFFDAPLPIGDTYTDVASGMTIETLSASAGGAQVAISNIPGSVHVDGGELQYRTLLGAEADIAVSNGGGAYTVTDESVSVLPAGNGCTTTPDPQTVSCADAGIDSGLIQTDAQNDRIALDQSVTVGFEIDTGSGDDTVTGGDGPDVIRAGWHADTVTGGGGADVIYGDSHNDNLSGGDGDDFLQGGYETDVVMGGAGIDTVSYADHNFTGVTVDLDGGLRDDGQPKEKDTNGADIEGIVGTCVADKLTGNGAVNVIMGSCGADKIYGAKSGSAPDVGDIINGDEGADKLYGRSGDDLIDGGANDDTVYGDKNNDILVGGPGVNTIKGGDGDDTLVSLPEAKDRLEGGRHNDLINAKDGDGIDRIICGPETDTALVDLLDVVQTGCESVL